jgi:endonuclease/exonuclease/phosphatase family metal-dependent hydrolase
MRRLRIVSWNIGRFYTPTSNNRLADADIPRVARTLDELDGDVVLLQEFVDLTQLRRLLARLPAYDGRMSQACRYDRHVAALAKRVLSPRFEDHVLEPTGRGLVTAVVDAGAHSAAVSSLHLDAFDGRGRRSQTVALLERHARRSESIVAVGGDFNLDPDWAAGIGARDDVDTFALYRKHYTEPRPVGPTLIGLLRVDHLLARGPAVAGVRLHVSPRRRLPLGDHDPIIADIDLRHTVVDVEHARA